MGSLFYCDCPGKAEGAGYYGNSIRWVIAEKRFVCGRTGMFPRPAAHGAMIREAGPYVALMEQEDVGRKRLELIKDLAKKLGRSARENMGKALKEAFDAE